MISKCITEEWKRIFRKGTPKMSISGAFAD